MRCHIDPFLELTAKDKYARAPCEQTDIGGTRVGNAAEPLTASVQARRWCS